jgi:hypothetical protein
LSDTLPEINLWHSSGKLTALIDTMIKIYIDVSRFDGIIIYFYEQLHLITGIHNFHSDAAKPLLDQPVLSHQVVRKFEQIHFF